LQRLPPKAYEIHDLHGLEGGHSINNRKGERGHFSIARKVLPNGCHNAFDPDGDLVLVLSKPPKTTNATSQTSAKGAAVPSSSKRKRGSSTQSVTVAEAEKIRMIVSSKHMMLASPAFKAMLQPGRFREGIRRNAAGQLEVDLPDDDQDIMVIVLNIIHGRNRLVPKQADPEMLTKLAILVDKYQMVEVAESPAPGSTILSPKSHCYTGFAGAMRLNIRKRYTDGWL